MNMIYNGVNVDPIDLQQNIKITTTTKESDTEIDSHWRERLPGKAYNLAMHIQLKVNTTCT